MGDLGEIAPRIGADIALAKGFTFAYAKKPNKVKNIMLRILPVGATGISSFCGSLVLDVAVVCSLEFLVPSLASSFEAEADTSPSVLASLHIASIGTLQ